MGTVSGFAPRGCRSRRRPGANSHIRATGYGGSESRRAGPEAAGAAFRRPVPWTGRPAACFADMPGAIRGSTQIIYPFNIAATGGQINLDTNIPDRYRLTPVAPFGTERGWKTRVPHLPRASPHRPTGPCRQAAVVTRAGSGLTGPGKTATGPVR